MNPFVFGIKAPEHGWLEPAVHDLLALAQKEAARRGAPEVSLEHFLLSALIQNDTRVMSFLVALGLDPASLRGHMLERPGPLKCMEETGESVPLSQELQTCIDQAIAAAHTSGLTFVSPEHVLLSTLNHQWNLSSDKLLERLNASDTWQALLPICTELAHQERRMLFYIQNLVHFLSRSQEPAVSFDMLSGLEHITSEMQTVLAAIPGSANAQMEGKRRPQEVLLVGSPYTTGRKLAEAVAFAIGTRLLSFSFSGLVTMCAPFTTYLEVKRLKDQRLTVQNNCFSRHGIALARCILQRFFSRAHHMSPCILLIEDIDASDFAGRTRVDEIRDQLLSLLFTEIERLPEGSQTIIVATAAFGTDIAFHHLQSKGLLHTPHFERKLLIENGSTE